MEVRARYTLIGLFTLGVMLAGFLFVYWLESAGGLGERATYRVRFDAPVAGLLKGSPVLFNGIRVGEVAALRLDADKPRDVVVEIAIDKKAPVRADTVIGIEFQGLAGAPVVALSGGTPSLPLLATLKGEPPVLVAEKNAGQSMTQAAREVLRRIDSLVSDNSEPLKGTISSLQKFTEALARNSDKVDGIVAGLERLTGAKKATPRVLDLMAAQNFASLKRPDAQLIIAEPTALAMFENDKILVRGEGSDPPSVENAQWPDITSKLVQARMVESFENAQMPRVMARVPDTTRADFQLMLDVRRFEIATRPAIRSEVEISAKLLRADGSVADLKVFKASAPAASLEASVASKAINDAFQRVAADIVEWSSATMLKARP